MRTDWEYLDRVEKIARGYVQEKRSAVDCMNDITAIFKEMWDE